MYVIFLLFLLVVLILIYLFMRQRRKFIEEINQLPPEHAREGLQHALLGSHLHLVVKLPEFFRNHPGIVMFASPDCDKCAAEMDEFLRAPDRHTIPFACFYKFESIESQKVERFIAKYGDRVPLFPIANQQVEQLQIDHSPFALMLDSQGVVHRVQRPLKRLLDYYRNRKDHV